MDSPDGGNGKPYTTLHEPWRQAITGAFDLFTPYRQDAIGRSALDDGVDAPRRHLPAQVWVLTDHLKEASLLLA